jgi:dihydrofolate reductase
VVNNHRGSKLAKLEWLHRPMVERGGFDMNGSAASGLTSIEGTSRSTSPAPPCADQAAHRARHGLDQRAATTERRRLDFSPVADAGDEFSASRRSQGSSKPAREEPRMRQLITHTSVTLDGVMQAPGGPEEDPSGGFASGGWSFGYWDEQMGAVMGESMAKPFDLVLGRRTYEIFAAHWPCSNEPEAEPLNAATKHVASTTGIELGWVNSQRIEGDVPAGIRALKAQDGPELQVHGSANLIQTLLAHDLIDEFRVWIFPLVLGRGKRLFESSTLPAGLQLTSSMTSATGVIMATYRSGAEIKGGSFVPEHPSEAELARRAAQER